jgi:hypothetical protein
MKKGIYLVATGLLFVSMVLAGCASMAPTQKTIITKDNLSALKGTWSGTTYFSSASTRPVTTTLEFSNDTIPIQGTINLYGLPRVLVDLFPSESVSMGGNFTLNFKNGHISDKGTLLGTSGQNFLELTYYAGEKPRIDGWFYYYGANGTMTLTKE